MSDSDHAFNLGSDSRINGEPLSANPYTGGGSPEGSAWHRGWRDADLYWGSEVARRTFRPLPEVKQIARAEP